MRKLLPKSLKGPRSYFTDLDPYDTSVEPEITITKLKLQLLTKKRVIIAGSALFHDNIAKIVKRTKGLTEVIQDGAIAPALRDEFSNVYDFFTNYGKAGYSTESRSLYNDCVTHVVPWNLYKNSNWFKRTFCSELVNQDSNLSKYSGITPKQAEQLNSEIERLISRDQNSYFQKKHVKKASENLPLSTQKYINEYANLLYGFSGSKIVNSDPHLPDAGITLLTGSDLSIIQDERIFWDSFVESIADVISFWLRITPEVVEKLSFNEIIQIRRKLFDIEFIEQYEALTSQLQIISNLHNPKEIFEAQENIEATIKKLKERFSERIQIELSMTKLSKRRESGLIEVAKLLTRIGETTTLTPVYGTLQGIPKITALLSPKLADQINRRVSIVKRRINSMFEWSKEERQSLLEGYETILMHGFPTKLE